MFYCGIDIDKYNHEASIIDAEGKSLLDSSDYYQSPKARGKHHLTAVGAVARKLCNIIFDILRENRPYQVTPPKKTNHGEESICESES